MSSKVPLCLAQTGLSALPAQTGLSALLAQTGLSTWVVCLSGMMVACSPKLDGCQQQSASMIGTIMSQDGKRKITSLVCHSRRV